MKKDPEKLKSWLMDQYHGELVASERIKSLAYRESQNIVLMTIAEQEAQHAEWIKVLLSKRNIPAQKLIKEERYWDQTLPDLEKDPIQKIAAIGVCAETMRLERIRVIAEDQDAPADIRKVFRDILPQEEWHVKAFMSLTDNAHLASAIVHHQEGMNALGLTV